MSAKIASAGARARSVNIEVSVDISICALTYVASAMPGVTLAVLLVLVLVGNEDHRLV